MKKLLATAALSLTVAAGAAQAQDWPSRPVTLVVPYGAGAVTDVLARQLANTLNAQLGQPFIVENRPGGGSMVGSAYVAQATGDGYTLLVTTSAIATGPAVLADVPFDVRTDLAPIGLAGYIPMIFVGGPSTSGATLVEFLQEARERPLFAATAGLGTTTHFTVEMLMQAAGVEMEAVHYSGGGEAIVAVLGGHADIYASTPGSSLDNIRSGNLRGLGVAGEQRSAVLPDVPSTAEMGIEGVNASFWLGAFAPASIDPALADQINEAMNTALADEGLRAALSNIDLQAQTGTRAEFAEQFATELDYWADLASERGLAPN